MKDKKISELVSNQFLEDIYKNSKDITETLSMFCDNKILSEATVVIKVSAVEDRASLSVNLKKVNEEDLVFDNEICGFYKVEDER